MTSLTRYLYIKTYFSLFAKFYDKTWLFKWLRLFYNQPQHSIDFRSDDFNDIIMLLHSNVLN